MAYLCLVDASVISGSAKASRMKESSSHKIEHVDQMTSNVSTFEYTKEDCITYISLLNTMKGNLALKRAAQDS